MNAPVHPALQIDVLAAGRRIEDDFFNLTRRISVGRSPQNTIVLPDESAPQALPLFRRSRRGYKLRLDPGLEGFVSPSKGESWQSLSELSGRDLELTEGMRGRLEIGDETLVFEMVPGPLPLPSRRWLATLSVVLAALVFTLVFLWIFTSGPYAL